MFSQELNTILAALNVYMESGMGNADNRSQRIEGIATNSGTELAFADDDLENLIQRLNLGDIELSVPKDYPHESNVKLEHINGTVGWGLLEEDGSLVSAYSKTPMNKDEWTVVERLPKQVDIKNFRAAISS